MKNNDKILLGTACFLGGVVAGFLISPIKKGMYFGNNCGNHFKDEEQFKKVMATCKESLSEENEKTDIKTEE